MLVTSKEELRKAVLKGQLTTPFKKRPLDCTNFGGEIPGETVECPSCSGKVNLKLFKCSVHGKCLPTLAVNGIKSCVGCNEHSSKHPTYHTIAPEMKLQLLQQLKVEHFPHYGKGGGDGIVYVGGGKYWPMIVAGIRVLRDTGCTLPVEVWYRGQCEEVNPLDIVGLNVLLCDIDAMSSIFRDWRLPTGNAASGGWEAKLYAIYHTNFDRILFLDADAYCIKNPEELFNNLLSSTFVYWRDFNTQLKSIKWERILDNANKSVPPIQGGQLLIDRKESRKLIHLCNWMCQHSDYYFDCMYGDQDSWRVALATGMFHYHALSDIAWKWNIAFDCSYGGNSYIIHRCAGKLLEPKHIPKGNRLCTNPKYEIPREADLFSYFADAVNRKGESAKDIFSEIYARGIWDEGTGKSGGGSVLKAVQPIVDSINRILRSNNWTSVADVGCGNGLIGSNYDASTYVGYDCASEMVFHCQKKYPEKSFRWVDIHSDYGMMDEADCLICKDVLHHHSNEWVRTFIRSLIESRKWKGLIFVQDCNQLREGQDCHTGGFRPLSSKMKPLSEFTFTHRSNYGNKELLLLKLTE